MTVAATTNRKTYTGDNVTTSFATSPVIFYLSSNLQVRVTVIATGVSTLLTENTHYTVSGGSAAGATGTVSLAGGSSPHGALLSTEKLVILRVLPLTQASDFVNNNNSDAEVLEAALDKLTDVDQQLSERQDRALTFPEGDVSGSTTTIPGVSTRALKALGFDSEGKLSMLLIAVGGSLIDLATSIGSSLVGFIQSGTGAVARTAQDKLREIFNSADNPTIGAHNVGLGVGRLAALTTGNHNVAVGDSAMAAATTAINSTAVGDHALASATTAQNNTAVGINALQNVSGVPAGNNNTAVGFDALQTNVFGDNNVAIGYAALNLTVFDENVAVGVNALTNLGNGRRNTAVGSYACMGAGTYLQVVAVGYNALNANTANNNTGVGGVALALNTSGTGNTGVGTGAAQSNTTANSVTAVGLNAAATSNAADITAVGTNALLNTTGASNTALGSGAGSTLTTGNNNTVIGASAQASAVGVTNEITLGNSTQTIIRSAAGIRAGTETGNFQAVATLYMGTGVPNNANGQNGDFYNRSDGTVAGNNIHYHKEAGAWVAYT